MLWVYLSLSFLETSLMHWAHGIKDTNTLDAVRDDYLWILCWPLKVVTWTKTVSPVLGDTALLHLS